MDASGLRDSYLSTILICNWSALYLDLPADTDSQVKVFGRKSKYIALSLVAPGLISGIAIDKQTYAGGLTRNMPSIIERSGNKVTILRPISTQ